MEKTEGDESQTAYARECVAQAEAGLQKIFGSILTLTDKIGDVVADATKDVQDLIEAKENVVTEFIDFKTSHVMEETNAVNDARTR